MAKTTKKKKKTKSPDPHPWRTEPVVVYRDDAGNWKVTPPAKVVSIGETILWETVPHNASFSLDFKGSNALSAPLHDNKQGTATAQVLGPVGYYPYTATCSRKRAKGNSDPSVIIDG